MIGEGAVMPADRALLTRLRDTLAGRRPLDLARDDVLLVCLVQLWLIDRRLDGADADTLAAFRMAWDAVFGEGEGGTDGRLRTG